MKISQNIIRGFLTIMLGTTLIGAQAGNEDRAGSAGATELLINPWARTSGWGTAGISSVKGLESIYSNIAGLAFTDRTQVQFARTNWLGQISDISMNAFGLAQRVGESGVLGISVMTMDFGVIDITTTEMPEGNIGTFNPKFSNFSLAYAKQFSPSISGGINLKVISESIANMGSQGVAIDAGIRYVTGEHEQTKFAISLKNVGPPMQFSGDGLSLELQNNMTGLVMTSQQRVSSFELPSQLLIGASYDFIFSEKHILTAAGTFVSNSFTRDQWAGGGEYQFKGEKAYFTLRGGLIYEKGVFGSDSDANALGGPSGGFSVDFPMGEAKNEIGLDYAFRTSNLGPIHTIGVRIDLKN